MAVNPVGAVPLFDSEVPRTITARASVGVTGGQLVYFSGANNSLSSGADSYTTNDIVVGGAASGLLFNGIVITPGNTASGTNNYVAVAQNGTYIITSAATILAGDMAYANGGDAITSKGVIGIGAGSSNPIGRILTPAGSEGWSAVTLFG